MSPTHSLVFALLAALSSLSPSTAVGASSNEITVCSFNIQWIGISFYRDNEGLADLTEQKGCDIVVVQELASAPSEKYLASSELTDFEALTPDEFEAITSRSDRNKFPPLPAGATRYAYPNTDTTRTAIRPDKHATEFFDAMIQRYPKFVLSPEDTGTSERIHSGAAATEWFVTFYNPSVVEVAEDLPHGYIARDRSANPHYQRVPFAFPFRTLNGGNDFVLVSVHLQPNRKHWRKRKTELSAIRGWTKRKQRTSEERDFIILGDMNIDDLGEFEGTRATRENERISVIPEIHGKPIYTSLNAKCEPTNTSLNVPKPFDHVLIDPEFTTENEVPSTGNFVIHDLADHFRDLWPSFKDRWIKAHLEDARPEEKNKPFPPELPEGNSLEFRFTYTDHHLVSFQLKVGDDDDVPQN